MLADPHAILDLLPHGVIVVGRDWRILYTNREADRMIGRDQHPEDGTLWQRCPAIERTAFASAFRYAMVDQSEMLTESALPSVGWCQARVRPTPDRGLLIALRQVHAHTVETGQARAALLLGEIGDALTREDALGPALQRCAAAIVRQLDAALARIWIVTPGGLSLAATAGADARLAAADATHGYGQHKAITIADTRAPYLTNDVAIDPTIGDLDWVRRERLVSYAGYPLRIDDQIVGVLTMYSRRKIAHDTLNGLSAIVDSLALGVAHKSAQAETAQLMTALARSNRELDQFAYVTSHDLKAPLRGIANLSQWIEDDLGDRLDDQSRKHLELLRGRVVRLENLIGGILAYSRAGREPDAAVAVDVAALATEAWELLAPPASARLVLAPDLPQLVTSKTQLQQILLNLLDNAIKHNPEHAALEVAVSARRDGARWELSVADSGAGIAPELADQVWGLFQTLERRDKRESTGIGLSVVRKIVERHGGRTWVEPGAGATFKFTWPA